MISFSATIHDCLVEDLARSDSAGFPGKETSNVATPSAIDFLNWNLLFEHNLRFFLVSEVTCQTDHTYVEKIIPVCANQTD